MPRDDLQPFAITLEVELLDRLSEPVRDGRAKSVSEIIRRALERFDFSNIVVMKPSQLQISVRLPPEVRRSLRQTARRQHASIGQLVRAAVESYLPEVESAVPGQLEIPIETAASAVVAPSSPRRRRRKKRAARATVRRKSRAGLHRRGMTKKRKG